MLNFCSHQQCERLWQGNWEKDFLQSKRIKGENGVAHNKLFGSESLGKRGYFRDIFEIFAQNYQCRRSFVGIYQGE